MKHWLLIVIALIPSAAFAGAPEELSGLFVQSCLPYAGKPAALRQWAAAAKLPEVPDPARSAFLNRTPGKVFDASNPVGKFVLLSSDDGLCAAVTDHANEQEVVHRLEDALRKASIALRLVSERDDPVNPKLHNREYLATGNGRSWRILAATVHDNQPGQAMLTAAPER